MEKEKLQLAKELEQDIKELENFKIKWGNDIITPAIL